MVVHELAPSVIVDLGDFLRECSSLLGAPGWDSQSFPQLSWANKCNSFTAVSGAGIVSPGKLSSSSSLPSSDWRLFCDTHSNLWSQTACAHLPFITCSILAPIWLPAGVSWNWTWICLWIAPSPASPQLPHILVVAERGEDFFLGFQDKANTWPRKDWVLKACEVFGGWI